MIPEGAKLVQSGRDRLRPRARLVQAMGEDLISNQIIALVELIKNSYDADAHRVEIHFEPPLEPGKGAITVRDDGHGISLKVLQTAWMEPATASKKNRPLSPRGRRVTGEKGLGRFAAARIAQKMRLESVTRSPYKLVSAEFDWEKFKNEDRYLDQIRCSWKEYRVTLGSSSGTVIRLEVLRDTWDLAAFRRLRGELARLIVRDSKKDDFVIELNLPEKFSDLAGPVTPPPILDRPHYEFRGEMLKSGRVKGKLRVGDEETVIRESIKLEGGRSPSCGPFYFDLRAWDRDALDSLANELRETVRDLRRDLNEAAGVSVYRDSFRVLPYGGPANDWLRLDLRRVQNPTMRVSNNQVVGSVYITADGNPLLRDQTNREGIVESDALADLRSCVVETLAILEGFRYERRRRGYKPDRHGGLFDNLDLAPVKSAFAARYPGDAEFLSYLEEREQSFKSSVTQIQEVIVRYRRLATLGQLTDVVLHDGRTAVALMANEAGLLKRDISKAANAADVKEAILRRCDAISGQAEVLSGLFRRISPFGGRKRGRPKDVSIEAVIRDSFAILSQRIEELGVSLTLPASDTIVKLETGEMQQVMVNLLDNALYWLEKVPRDEREIIVRAARSEGGLEILFCDSGPGIPENARDFIFDPYFTTKPDGVGIGLTIAGEIIAEYGGSLELVEPGLLPGANFRVVLRTRV